jgi:hypothetical protein
MNNSPEFTASVGAEYRFPLGKVEGFLATDARYNSRLVAYDVVNGTSLLYRSDDVFNMNLRAGVQAGHWTLSAFAENLTDGNNALTPATTSSPFPTRQRPRTVGVQATFGF